MKSPGFIILAQPVAVARPPTAHGRFSVQPWSNTNGTGELKWQNIDADDLPTDVKKSFDAMIEAEAAFKADLEMLLKKEGHMPEDKYLLMSRKGRRIGFAYTSTSGGGGSLKFKTQ